MTARHATHRPSASTTLRAAFGRVVLSPIAALSLLVTPAHAAGLSCDDIMNMVNHSVPAAVIVDTMQGSGARFTDADLQCLRERGAYPEVLAQAQVQRAAAPAPAPMERAPEPDPVRDAARQFDQAESLGDLESFDDEGDAGASGFGASDLDSLIRDFKAKKYRTASFGLYDLLEENAYPEKDSVIKYYLAKSLQELEMYHASQFYYMEVIRKGPSNPLFKHALPRLAQVSTRIGDDTELLRIVGKISPETFPNQARPQLYYLLGRKAYESEALSEAVAAFERVPARHPLYPRAQYMVGIIQYQREKLKSAVRAFREVIQSEVPIDDPTIIAEIEDLKDLSILNVARVYYKLQKFDTADINYDKVDRNSTYWPQALFERAWTNFWTGDLNETLGLVLTVDSPYFSDTHFLPDTQYLKALTYFQLCEYADVERVLTLFEAKYIPVRAEMRETIDYFRSEGGQQAFELAYEKYFGDKADASTIPVATFSKILRNRDLAALIKHMDIIDTEIASIDVQTPQWRDTIGEHLRQVLVRDRQRYMEKAGRAFLQELLEEYRNIEALLQDADVLRFEVADAQRQDYMYKATNFTVDDLDAQPVDFATNPDIIYWPFNGEFWIDELAYYRYTERGSCN